MTLVVANSPGGGYDIYMRSFAPVLERVAGVSARVSNITGGGGKAALLRVADAPAGDLAILIENMTELVVTLASETGLGHAPDSLPVLGIVQTEAQGWVGRPGIDLAADHAVPLVAGGSSIEQNLVEVGVAGMALGHVVRLITGYAGSGETITAIARGEIDFSSRSVTSVLKAQRSGDAAALLVLSRAPDPALPGVPWFAGPDGLVAQRAAALPEDQRTERLRMADVVVELSTATRALFAPPHLSSETRACLTEAVEIVLFDPAFRDAAEAQGRPVAPGTAAEGAEAMARTIAAFAQAAPLLKQAQAAVQP